MLQLTLLQLPHFRLHANTLQMPRFLSGHEPQSRKLQMQHPDIINMKLGGVDRMHYWQMNYYAKQLNIRKIWKLVVWDLPYWIRG